MAFQHQHATMRLNQLFNRQDLSSKPIKIVRIFRHVTRLVFHLFTFLLYLCKIILNFITILLCSLFCAALSNIFSIHKIF